jgi:hypothetical protein
MEPNRKADDHVSPKFMTCEISKKSANYFLSLLRDSCKIKILSFSFSFLSFHILILSFMAFVCHAFHFPHHHFHKNTFEIVTNMIALN